MNYYNYFTEIEEHFVRRRGKHLLISPLDWSLISTWRESGVPLHVALRGIDIAMDTWDSKPHRPSDRLSTLFYCHDAVMAEYARHLEAHIGESTAESRSESGETASPQKLSSDQGPDKGALLAFLEARIREIKSLRAKHYQGENDEGIDRILSRLDEILHSAATEERQDLEALDRDLGILDALLIPELRSEIPIQQLDGWEQEARRELKIYKKRLPKETYDKIVENYLRGRIHRHYNIGELSLFQL
jgi:hypothetical protein